MHGNTSVVKMVGMCTWNEERYGIGVCREPIVYGAYYCDPTLDLRVEGIVFAIWIQESRDE